MAAEDITRAFFLPAMRQKMVKGGQRVASNFFPYVVLYLQMRPMTVHPTERRL
jgi:hypothetical protein